MRDTRADITLASGGSRTPFLTYEPYYGLKEKPFSLSADPRFLYKSRAHAAVYDDLRAGIRRREGLIVLTGDIGTGKTTLCRSVLKDLDRKTFSTFVPDPFVSREDLLKMLLIDFGVMSVDDLKSGRLNGASRPDLSYPLYEFLRALVPLQAFAVLVIDEAQNLPLSLLEEIRILSDLEGPEKLLQVVLVGQLEFLPKLKDPQMRQVDQRVSVRCQLGALDRAAVAGYIAHRLSVAGGGSDRVNFSEDALDAIYRATNGNPRLINLVCDKSLHHGHLTRTFNIGAEIVGQALTELGVTQLTAAPDPMADFRPERTVPEVTAPLPIPEAIVAFSEEAHEEAPPQALLEHPAPHLSIGLERALKWMAAGLAGLGVGVFVLMMLSWRSPEQARAAATPTSPQTPVNTLLRDVALPHLPVSATSGDATAGSFEIGVAVFAKPTRAGFLEAELAAAGFKATTHLIELAGSPMFEVRTGPYASREAVDADVARIRQMPGYADARVIAPSPAPQ
jgi:type II secretory pathway predicted ATPase ExeA